MNPNPRGPSRWQKREWTLEEEEKLLRYTDSMPNQWFRISLIMGRTAGDCSSHYEKLLVESQRYGEIEEPEEVDISQFHSEVKPARGGLLDFTGEGKQKREEHKRKLKARRDEDATKPSDPDLIEYNNTNALKRIKLHLPEPQVTDEELALIANKAE